jgi:lipid A 3-O-deacylase
VPCRVLIAVLAPLAAVAADWQLVTGPAASGAFDDTQRPWGFVEVRAPWRIIGFSPWIAAEGWRHDVWAGGGLSAEARIGRWLRFRPSFGVGWYDGDASGLDLGHPLELRTAVELAHERPDGTRIGISLSHLSNAQLGAHNPGVEVLKLVLAIPLR